MYLFTFQNFCKLFESLRLSITNTNRNRPEACFTNTIWPYFGSVSKVPRTDKLRYRVQPTCRALLSTGRASALAMTRVWFLYFERVQERNLKSKISDWKQRLPITCASHICGFFDFRGIRWPLAFPGHVHRYVFHYITEITVLLILHGY